MGKFCEVCEFGQENYCFNKYVGIYNGVYFNGGKFYGGYVIYNCVFVCFVVKIFEGIFSVEVVLMLCGGVIIYVFFKYYGVGFGKIVGIVGFGGFGYFGVMWVKVFGVDKVVVIFRINVKKEDVFKMGVDEFIVIVEDFRWGKIYVNIIDLIVCIVSQIDMLVQDYFNLFKFDGVFVQVGLFDDGFLIFQQKFLIFKCIKIIGSLIGSLDDIREMFDLVFVKGVKLWIFIIFMKDVNQVIIDFEKGVLRYRFVLENELEVKVFF